MTINLPPKVRQALYIAVTIGSPVIGYLAVKSLIGEAEVALWAGLTTAVGILAAFNTDTTDEDEV